MIKYLRWISFTVQVAPRHLLRRPIALTWQIRYHFG